MILEFLIWLLANGGNYDINTDVNFKIHLQSDSLSNTESVIAHKTITLQLPVDYNILGKLIYYCPYNDKSLLSSGICTQLNISVGNGSEYKVFFVTDNKYSRSINKFIIGYSPEEVLGKMKMYDGYEISHNTSIKTTLKSIAECKNIYGLTEINNNIYTSVKLINGDDLTPIQKDKLKKLGKKYQIDLTRCFSYSPTSSGQYRVSELILLDDSNVVLKINGLNYLYGVNAIKL